MSTVEVEIQNTSEAAGYIKSAKITDTLQGSIWRSVCKPRHKTVVIKVTDRYLHKKHITTDNIRVHENIKKEISILKHLSADEQCPKSLTKYIDAFKTNLYYFLVMEDGGSCLFSFIQKAHGFITNGVLDIAEWHKIVKVIFKQMIECIQYIHRKNVSHFDISLENFLINYVQVKVSSGEMQLCTESVQIKLCDFGLSQMFKYSNFQSNKYCGKMQYQSPEIRLKHKRFCAQSNDIWCLGICFFMMIFGSAPWKMAQLSDPRFAKIMFGIRGIIGVLSAWNVLHYLNDDILDIIVSIFEFEDARVSLIGLKRCKWLDID